MSREEHGITEKQEGSNGGTQSIPCFGKRGRRICLAVLTFPVASCKLIGNKRHFRRFSVRFLKEQSMNKCKKINRSAAALAVSVSAARLRKVSTNAAIPFKCCFILKKCPPLPLLFCCISFFCREFVFILSCYPSFVKAEEVRPDLAAIHKNATIFVRYSLQFL